MLILPREAFHVVFEYLTSTRRKSVLSRWQITHNREKQMKKKISIMKFSQNSASQFDWQVNFTSSCVHWILFDFSWYVRNRASRTAVFIKQRAKNNIRISRATRCLNGAWRKKNSITFWTMTVVSLWECSQSSWEWARKDQPILFLQPVGVTHVIDAEIQADVDRIQVKERGESHPLSARRGVVHVIFLCHCQSNYHHTE